MATNRPAAARPIPPGPALILRSSQKDQQFLLQLKNETHGLTQKLVGLRKWMLIRQEVDSITTFGYYLLTTLSGLQTLGEEYVRIVQTDTHRLAVPLWIRRFLMVLLHSFGPLIGHHLFNKLEKLIQNPNKSLGSPALDDSQTREKLLAMLPYLKNLMVVAERIHLILFYFNGSFYHLSKRLSKINYTSTRRWHSNDLSAYKILGWLTLSQLCLSIIIQYYSSLSGSLKKPAQDSGDQPSENVKSIERCLLCLERRKQSTATPCGHLFCWYCIFEWIQLKNECPICRETVEASRLVLLNNYF